MKIHGGYTLHPAYDDSISTSRVRFLKFLASDITLRRQTLIGCQIVVNQMQRDSLLLLIPKSPLRAATVPTTKSRS